VATAFQFAEDPPTAIAWKLFVDVFDLLPQPLVIGVTLSLMFLVWLVVIAAGSQPSYLADLRN